MGFFKKLGYGAGAVVVFLLSLGFIALLPLIVPALTCVGIFYIGTVIAKIEEEANVVDLPDQT